MEIKKNSYNGIKKQHSKTNCRTVKTNLRWLRFVQVSFYLQNIIEVELKIIKL